MVDQVDDAVQVGSRNERRNEKLDCFVQGLPPNRLKKVMHPDLGWAFEGSLSIFQKNWQL